MDDKQEKTESTNIEKIIQDLSANYREDKEVLEDILENMTSIACDISNRKADDEKLFPYIKKAVKAEYLARGNEGLTSRTEGSISSSYEDIVQTMRNNIIKNGVRRLK